ncbi:hypothetical protein ROZALSC1DRAFT_29203 [Rozella allomycis CSF55]|uniref:Uncharacterized protein n=1 Tax=Rozella allomycis (strain CSF55) TaxID=988480 RepID=A0A075B1R6_ROZAC|nr:hypothetical protein O9G_004673 [Rozella allomycis CSF55]RKP19170.1 hypothetical protein ROZALSC1DRAFT_29203 [Rozella allomycis CSF55]|eukprot:EPZ36303.1 hypothetical protein O9G_004673 [Rozella allomycis CSF55]
MVDEVDDYERFKRAYMNEKFSPEILTFPFECFDNMMLYLEQRNDDIQQANDRQVKNGPLELNPLSAEKFC